MSPKVIIDGRQGPPGPPGPSGVGNSDDILVGPFAHYLAEASTLSEALVLLDLVNGVDGGPASGSSGNLDGGPA